MSDSVRYYRIDVENLLDIKKDTYYKWLKYLSIKPQKDENQRTYLNQSDLERLSDLKDYYQEKGMIDGFLGDSENENESAIATTESAEMTAESLEIPDTETFEPDSDRIFEEAAHLKAQYLMMPDLVKLHLAEQMSLEDLPKELRDRVAAAREAANPTQSPAQIAANLLQRRRKSA